MVTKIAFCLSLIAIWIGLNVDHNINYIQILTSICVAGVVFLMSFKLKVLPKHSNFNWQAISYILWLAKEILMSAIKVIRIAYRKNLGIIPVLDVIKSNQTLLLGRIIYANSITLTPGTVTLNLEDNYLLVHALDIEFMEDLATGEMDKNVSSILSKEKKD